MNIFPNPASSAHFIVINFDRPLSGILSISIYDQEGDEVYAEWIRDVNGITTYRMSLCHIKRGQYIMKVSNNGETGIQKLLLQ